MKQDKGDWHERMDGLKEMFLEVLELGKSSIALNYIKHWVNACNACDEDSPIDELAANICAKFIYQVAAGVNEALDKAKEEQGSQAGISGKQALQVAADVLDKLRHEILDSIKNDT